MNCINGNTECGCLRGTVGMLDTGIKGSVGLVGKPICGTVGMLDTGIKGSVGFICTPNTDVYLFVEPEVIWLSPETLSADFAVRSNTNWRIE